jgi:hypothetical protein
MGQKIHRVSLVFARMTKGLRQGKIAFQKVREGLCVGGLNLGLAYQ